MAPVPNTRPDGDDEDPRPIKQPRLGEAEDSKEEKPKPEPDADPKALDDQSPLVEVEDEPADTNPVAPNDQEPVPNEQSPPGEAEDDPADFVEEPLRCSICMEEGHSYMSCPLTWFCPPETAVSDLAEIVCYCCCERIDSGVHSNIPARMTRAQLIPRWPRCMPDVDTKALELELHTKQPQLGEAEDVKEEKPKPDPMALDDDQALQPTKQSPLVEAEDEPTGSKKSVSRYCYRAPLDISREYINDQVLKGVTEEKALKAPIKDHPPYFVLGSSRKVVDKFMSQKSILFRRYFSFAFFALINPLIYMLSYQNLCCFVLIRS
ncbi:uncharacterized protein [Malus domestica]|uniref:uncharacterized protein isoform X3 n=1 Tax=Malus domestica TaxID=3750 RepID=UPI00397653E1